MGRWTQYDEDDYRLPSGFTRVGYDADTGQYSYRDRSGSEWTGAPYAQYGPLRPVGGTHRADAGVEVDAEEDLPSPTDSRGRNPKVSLDEPWTPVTKEMADLNIISNPMLPHRSQTPGGRLIRRTRELAQRIRSKSVSAVRDRIPGLGGDAAQHETIEDEPKPLVQTETLRPTPPPAVKKEYAIHVPSTRRNPSGKRVSGSASAETSKPD
ncbi:hypothetical protein GYMLUDRAFT_768715 [Collybiopsis luxurians FD-317 M1]|uniref:Carbohydrate-binding module family 50 protein n=1 Tax=Collybiopsis luxurians FD-317 M1 TaxID=944289 RepID=A0A0D0CPM5_9AGAR|nr:hypothetical protein GYMLUDRAFT_768715 [Collybiopsis luxurians FD-317 M1]